MLASGGGQSSRLTWSAPGHPTTASDRARSDSKLGPELPTDILSCGPHPLKWANKRLDTGFPESFRVGESYWFRIKIKTEFRGKS
jgi:hypothetical protein